MLRSLNEWNLLIKSKKCVFHVSKIDFLKFLIDKNDIKMNSNKTAAVRDWKRSKNVTEVLAFLGFTNYNRRFIKRYSHKALPLTKLTQKGQPWSWNDKTEQAFQKLKQACLEASILKIFNSRKPIRIETNVSDMTIGACLCQKYDDKWHSVAYFSRKLTPAEQNYEIHDKELLTIVTALKTWKIYAKGASEFIILTNHKNFLYFIITKKLNRKQVRWSEELEQYKFTIRYTSNKNNDKANALSRQQDYNKKKPNTAFLKSTTTDLFQLT